MGAYDDFVSRVSSMLRRGSVYDSDIPQFISDAQRGIENLHSWQHLWNEDTGLTLSSGDRDITLSGFIKSIPYLRFQVTASVSPGGQAVTYYYVPRKQPEEIAGLGTLNNDIYPTVYYVQSRTPTQTVLRLSNTFTEDKTYDVGYRKYSDLDDNNFWLSYDQGLLLAATLVDMAPYLRDPKLLGMWQQAYDRKLRLAEEGDIIQRHEGEQMAMTPYSDDLGEDLFDNWNDRRL